MDVDFRSKLPAFKNEDESCPKCGSCAIRLQWHSDSDTLTITCGCGYYWITLPLDESKKSKV